MVTIMDWSTLISTCPRFVASVRLVHMMRIACIFVICASTVFSRVIRTPKFLCEENGYFLNPYNCSGFYLCVEGVAEWHPCPDHLHPRWESAQEVYCDIPENVNCTSLYARAVEDRRVPESGSYEDVCSGQPDGIYPDPEYCFRFVMCSAGFRLDFDCPIGMGYDRARGICVNDEQCAYDGTGHMSGDNNDTADGNSLKMTGGRSREPVEVVEMGSGAEEATPEEDITSANPGYMKINNNRVKELKRNIDSVLNQIYRLLSLSNAFYAKDAPLPSMS